MRILTRRERLQSILDQIDVKRQADREEIGLLIELIDARRKVTVLEKQHLLYNAWRRIGSMSVMLRQSARVSYADKFDGLPTAGQITKSPNDAASAYHLARLLAELSTEEEI